jgi:hypothetical protein
MSLPSGSPGTGRTDLAVHWIMHPAGAQEDATSPGDARGLHISQKYPGELPAAGRIGTVRPDRTVTGSCFRPPAQPRRHLSVGRPPGSLHAHRIMHPTSGPTSCLFSREARPALWSPDCLGGTRSLLIPDLLKLLPGSTVPPPGHAVRIGISGTDQWTPVADGRPCFPGIRRCPGTLRDLLPAPIRPARSGRPDVHARRHPPGEIVS